MAEIYPITKPVRFNARCPDLTGMVFGRLAVLRLAGKDKSNSRFWECQCECGRLHITLGRSLRNGSCRSCGCLHNEEFGNRWRTHDRSRTPEHRIWIAMISRCNDPHKTGYENYGGRGINVCKRWRESFEAFFGDMGERPSPKHTIERRNNDKGYSPDNCYWATRKEQARNRRTNRLLTYHGETLPVCEWAERIGISNRTLLGRLNCGWSVDRAIETPINTKFCPKGIANRVPSGGLC